MSGTSLTKYETARRAVAAARHDLARAASVQEVTDIRSKAGGIRAYAKAAKDRNKRRLNLELDTGVLLTHWN